MLENRRKPFFRRSNEYNFVILLPIINAIATVTTGYFSAGGFNPGTIRGYLIIIYSLYFIIKKYPNTRITNTYSVFFIFTFILVFFSSDVAQSLNIFSKMYVGGVLFVFAYYFSKYPDFLEKISITILISLFIYLMNFVISNSFNLGATSYEGVTNELYFGVSGVNLAKSITAILLMFPILMMNLKHRRSKLFGYILLVAGVIFVLIAFKRSAILALAIGYITYLMVMRNRSNIKNVLAFLIIMLALSPIFLDQVVDTYKAREKSVKLYDEENLDKQARYHEVIRVFDAWKKGSIGHKLFGSELFNDRKYFNTRRMLHIDYMTLLNGAGAIGLILFLLSYYSIYRSLKRTYKSKNDFTTKTNYAIGSALIVALIFFGFAGTVHGIEPRGTIFFFLGALVGYNKSTIGEKTISPNKHT